MTLVKVYDTTLRDGSQMEGISFSVNDKVGIARKLDEIGVDYVEGGWPFSNPKDLEFYRIMSEEPLKQARLAAFGMTCRADRNPDEDDNILSLLSSGAPTVTLFGKTWDLHVHQALKTSLDNNLQMIRNSIAYLVSRGKEVIFDAEHFFDGYADNPDYALKTLEAAAEGGAGTLVLCDTNGGTLTDSVAETVKMVCDRMNMPVGIHAHNDSGLAVANSLMAVKAGAVQVQSTVNGFGERCGNADMCAIVPALNLKMGYVTGACPENMFVLSKYVYEIANINPDGKQPYVGRSAFAHKGGVHASAVQRQTRTYEHVSPETVGNERRIIISEQAGKSNLLHKAEQMNISIDDGAMKEMIKTLVNMEHQGYQFEWAEASFELLMLKAIGRYRKLFDLEGFRVIIEKRGPEEELLTEATIKLNVDGTTVHTVAEGDGPVHALDNALRKALLQFYPELDRLKLSDFKVRVINERAGTAAKVRVLVESTDGQDTWGTIGVSENIVEASWEALVDSITYSLQSDGRPSRLKSRPEIAAEG